MTKEREKEKPKQQNFKDFMNDAYKDFHCGVIGQYYCPKQTAWMFTEKLLSLLYIKIKKGLIK